MTDDRDTYREGALEAALRMSATALVLVGAEREVLLASAGAEALFGAEPGGLEGRPVTELVHADDATRLGCALSGLAPGPGGEGRMLRRRDEGGREGWLEWSISRAEPGGPVLARVAELQGAPRSSPGEEELEEMTGVGSWDVDLASGTLYQSPVTRRIHELEGGGHNDVASALDYYPGRARERVEAAFQRLREHGEPFDLTVPFVTARGREITVRATGTALRRGGQVVRAYGTFEDVTETVAAERHVRRLASIVEASPNAVLVTDPEGRLVWANAAFTEMTGYALEEVRGYAPGAVLQCDSTDPDCVARMHAALAAGEGFSEELVNRTKDGRDYWVHLDVLALRDAEGRITDFISIQQDITEHKRIEAALARARRLGRITEEALHEIYVCDAESLRFIEVNRAARENLGYDEAELLGMQACEIKPEITPETFRAMLAPLREGHQDKLVFRTEQRRRDGTRYPIELTVQMMHEDRPVFVFMGLDITEREAAERATRQAREQLVAAVETLADGFVLYDAEDRLVLCNSRYRELYPESAAAMIEGATFEEILRYGLARGQYADAVGREEDWLAERLEAHFRPSHMFEQQLRDGRVLRVLERETPDGGRVGLRIDITEQVESRRRAERAEQRLRDAINALPAAFWLFDEDDRLVMHNDRYVEFFPESAPAIRVGARFEDMIRYGLERGQYPEAIGREEEWLAGIMELRERPYYELEYPTSLGRWLKSYNQRTSDGGCVGFRVDISEIKQREADLQAALDERDAAEQRFFDIASVSTDWFWEQDAEGRFTFISESFERTTGGSCEAHIGKTRRELTEGRPEVRESADFDWLEARIAAREPFSDFVYRAATAGDRELWARISGAPIFDAEGTFRGYRGVGSDVTQLYSAMRRAEESSRAKSAFLANMSHEIRTPMNGILGMAEILSASLTEPEQKRMIATMRESGEILMNILNDILDVSKIEAGKLELDAVPFRPVEIARRVESLHTNRAQEKGISFAVMTGRGAEIERIGDPHRIHQVLQNLVSNAIKFTEEGEVTVTVRGGAQGGPLVIEVQDTGIGMTEAQTARIFEDFVQADNSTSRRFGGTGLGMAIVRKLIEAMQGEVALESRSGRGTRVRVSLPLALAPSAGRAPGSAADEAAPDRLPPGLTVLAADDNRTNRMVLEAMLHSLGVRATVVEDGEAAIEAAAAAHYDLLLLDISMPGLDGIETLAAIRRAERAAGQPPTPAIAVTANAMKHQVALYLNQGFAGHIPKPIRARELGAQMQACLARGESAEDRRAAITVIEGRSG